MIFSYHRNGIPSRDIAHGFHHIGLDKTKESLDKQNPSLYFEAGTGKTHIVEEFKATLDLNEIQWEEARAYAYSQDTSYFPLIDLFNRALQIKEGDPPERVREKPESGLESLIEKTEQCESKVLLKEEYPSHPSNRF